MHQPYFTIRRRWFEWWCTGTISPLRGFGVSLRMRERMAEWDEVKGRGIMGSDQGELKEVVILGRTVRWTREGLEYEADRKHRKILLQMSGLDEGSKFVGSPAVKEGEGSEWVDEEVELQGSERRRYRDMTARLNYMGQDRSDVQYATKELSVNMAKPTVGGLRKLKRVVRYLAGAESVVWKMREWGEQEEVRIDVYVDSDWAKSEDRRSTSGGVIVLGGAGVKHWSRAQRSRALSVGEAEYYALVSGSAEGLGLKSLMEDLGWDVGVKVWTDSSTAQSVASRRGLGKLRHVELRFLWVQEMVKRGRLALGKVWGPVNVADHLTKGKMVWEYVDLLRGIGGELRGRVVGSKWRMVEGAAQEDGWANDSRTTARSRGQAGRENY